MEDIRAHAFFKNSREIVVSQVRTFNGYPLAHFQVFVKTREGKIIPTRKGLAVSPAHLLNLETAVRAVRATFEELRAAGEVDFEYEEPMDLEAIQEAVGTEEE